MLAKALGLIENGGNTLRYHAKLTHRMETVGHHSFMVAWLAQAMWPEPGACPARLLMACLQHDIAEAVTGDMPGHTKKKLGLEQAFLQLENDILKEFGHHNWGAELNPQEQRVLTLADRIAGMLYCAQELKMGNEHLRKTYLNYQNYVVDMAPFNETEQSVVNYAVEKYDECK